MLNRPSGDSSEPVKRKPIRSTLPVCCARAASGQVAAVPPSKPMVERGRRALSRFRASRKIPIIPRGAASKDGKRHGTAAMAQESTTDLECRLAQAQRELSEAREQQTATADVLKVIS